MKKFIILAMCTMFCMLAASCGKKKQETDPAPKPKTEVYQPRHVRVEVDLKNIKTYNYFSAPMSTPAKSYTVAYNTKVPYAQPIEIKYTYANGDTYTYFIPDDFGLWENEAGRLRVVTDTDGTVWLQGQTKAGKFCEFVFYGHPQYNGIKITPNSYRNLPSGEIKYRK